MGAKSVQVDAEIMHWKKYAGYKGCLAKHRYGTQGRGDKISALLGGGGGGGPPPPHFFSPGRKKKFFLKNFYKKGGKKN